MSGLDEFLLARIAEDEAVARAAHVTTALPPIWDTSLFYGPSAPASEHIARHDPARVLAECEAKRQVVDAYRGLWEVAKVTARAGRDEEANVARNMYAGVELAMQALALPYADHPDYRQEWKP